MSSQRQPRITNIWSKVIESESGDFFTRVTVESTAAFEYSTSRRGNDIILEAFGALANMPEGTIEVNDGLVREISLTQSAAGAATVSICPDHPTGYKIEVDKGIPVRTSLLLDRSFLVSLFKGKKIVIDPGHGGKDSGGCGPVNLLEKNVVAPIAVNLKKLFEQVGAQALLTREGDEDVPPKNRIELARSKKADLLLSVHTNSSRDCKVGGTAVLFGKGCPKCAELARLVKDELLKKIKLADRGIGESKVYANLRSIPALEVEVVTITNWVEEGLLRSPTVHKKAAEGIFNGVKTYYATDGRQ